MKFNFFDIETYNSLTQNDGFIILSKNNNDLNIYLEKRFLPQNENEKLFFKEIIAFLGKKYKYKSFFNGSYSLLDDEIGGNASWEKNLFKNITDFDISHDVEVFLFGDINIEVSILSHHMFSSIIVKQKKKMKTYDEIIVFQTVIDELIRIRKLIKSKKAIYENTDSQTEFLSSFQIDKKNKEMKGYFFELICQFLFFDDPDFDVHSDLGTFTDNKKQRELGYIYPDMICLNKTKKEIAIIDSKCYADVSKVSFKEVLINGVVIKDILNRVKIPVYNFAIVPSKIKKKSFLIHKIFKIYNDNVIIVKIDIFNCLYHKELLKKIILSSQNYLLNKRVITIKIDENKKEWIKNYIK